MRVTREQAAARREQIVDVASELFRAHGFDGVAISEIMNAAGVTHGGFYGHFDSKEQLATEACLRAHQRTPWDQWLDGPVEQRLNRLVRAYLSERHRDALGRGCLFAAVASDVVRQPPAVRHAFTSTLKSKLELLLCLVPGQSAAARKQKALATLAGLVGALILSRAVDDPQLAADLLSAASNEFSKSPHP
jgi:TetR/AcrR family transcriptional regulator, transcriptional repressor for nem operon